MQSRKVCFGSILRMHAPHVTLGCILLTRTRYRAFMLTFAENQRPAVGCLLQSAISSPSCEWQRHG